MPGSSLMSETTSAIEEFPSLRRPLSLGRTRGADGRNRSSRTISSGERRVPKGDADGSCDITTLSSQIRGTFADWAWARAAKGECPLRRLGPGAPHPQEEYPAFKRCRSMGRGHSTRVDPAAAIELALR